MYVIIMFYVGSFVRNGATFCVKQQDQINVCYIIILMEF